MSTFGHQGATLIVIGLGPITYLNGLMVANVTQVILSWCYFAYNALLTRILVEREFNLLSQSFTPLRVSLPKGDQIVTWRLQLPYQFSIPLILVGILLHWLASNSIFFLIMEGGKQLLTYSPLE